MKNTRKILAVALVLVLALSMAIPAFAADTGKITVTNATENGTYNVYLMATLESASGTNYSYKAVTAWIPFFHSQNITVDSNGFIQYKSGIADIEALAKDAVAFAVANGIAPTKSATVEAGKDQVVIEALPLGYYCMDSQVGTVCSLTTTNPDATIEDKNPPVTINKTVMEDSTNNYGKINDDSIGKTVNYRLIINKRAGALNYVVTDTMSAGLTFNPASIKVYYHDSQNHEIIFTKWKLVTDFSSDPYTKYTGKTFIVELDNSEVQSLADGTRIFIDYTATINENAIIGVDGNPNVATIIYGNVPTESSETKTTTYVWDFNVLKFTKPSTEKTPLAGAKFKVVLKDTATSTASEVFLVLTQDDKMTASNGYPTYKVSAAPDSVGTEITTDSSGKFGIIGLDSGDYWLRETAAPSGYNPITYDIEVDIVAVGAYSTDVTLNYSIKHTVNGFIEVENNTGVKLPETGSFGTFMFTLIGSIVVLSMGTLLVVKKRMSKVVYTK